MKRLTLLLLVVSLLLCACGKKSAEATETSTQAETTVETTTQETTEEATTQATTEAVPTEYRNPLNGTLLDGPWTGRATAVVINNHLEAMPQCGVSSADILYEFETEGGITRRLGFFADLTDVETVGAIRSARTYFLSTAAAYDAVLVHCGGSKYASDAQYDMAGNKLTDWEHLDEMLNSAYFFRDADRQANGYAFEHTLFTTGEKLTKLLEAKGYNEGNEEGTDCGLRFMEDPEWKGETAKELTIIFRGGKETTATYNEETGRYAISQYGSVGIDANTGEEVATRNVLVVFAKQHNNGVHSFYDLIGSGDGYLACDGEIIPVHWEREAVDAPFTYTTEDGEPAFLGVGNSYIAVADGSVEYQ